MDGLFASAAWQFLLPAWTLVSCHAYEFFLAVIAVTAFAGIASTVFDDTLLQRAGMTGISFGAAMELWCKVNETGNGKIILILVGGVALYGTATTIKHWRKARQARLFRQSMRGKT